ncbi:hypothetical protein ACFOWM_04690 [Ferruginibacter yonginensis]|uniref:Uncharacterized protein n=1 Tax=Ferruginibacter yonginensis TaxID=1310416 RepID=A0ABV8QSY3_9BACT
MKRFAFVSFLVLMVANVVAQRINRVYLKSTGETEKLAVLTDDGATINMSLDGNIIDYGTEYFSERVANYSRLEKYNGRVDFFTQYDNAAFAGKLKYLGRTAITYYSSFDVEILRGKIKSIGSLQFTYYQPFEDELAKGKIKSIGSNQLSYYSTFDNVALKGKLKAVGITNINYYTSFDDKAFQGKVKAIGPNNFTYYASFDRQFAGGMKTGNNQLNVNGIGFYLVP